MIPAPRNDGTRGGRGRRVVVAIAATTVALLLGGGVAWAAWLSSGPGSGTARAGTINPPATGSAGTPTCTSATTATVPVSFAAASNATGYSVQWSDSSAFTTFTAVTTSTTSATVTITGVTAAKTIYVRVLSAVGNWQSSPSQAAPVAVGPCGSGCVAGSVTVNASADTVLDQAANTTNYGATASLSVSSHYAANRRTLVQFTLPTLPAGCTLDGATLALRTSSGAASRTIIASRVTQSWAENSVTWATRPTSTSAEDATSLTGSVHPVTQRWSVTAAVQAMYAGPNHGFLLRDQTEDSGTARTQTYVARQGTPPPQLVLTYS